jgi:hypothetical protein
MSLLPRIGDYLALERCPHCSVHKPDLKRQGLFEEPSPGSAMWSWGVYFCQHCRRPVVAGGPRSERVVPSAVLIIPEPSDIDEAVPEPARRYLQQAREALHAPDGATMLAASAVDALLKAKGYAEGRLYDRINRAAGEHVITQDMAAWAHQVRLEANDPRHADVSRPHATEEQAKQTLEFAQALAQFLFVLPARVARGMRAAGETPKDEDSAVRRTKRL